MSQTISLMQHVIVIWQCAIHQNARKKKTKDENGINTAINLTLEANRTLIRQKSCLDKNSK